MGSVLSKTESNEMLEVLDGFALSDSDLLAIKSEFLEAMKKGWASGQGEGASPVDSTLKMLTSHVNVFATGDEKGIYYAVDLGGTNLRILRVSLAPEGSPDVKELRRPIPKSICVKEARCEDLFDFIAQAAKELYDESRDTDIYSAGFTFSFPMSQTAINKGLLIEWTKGFETQECVGKDPAELLQAAFDRLQVPLQVAALCNDTVGTLMTCAYEFKGCPSCRIGVILGTGTNAAYVDPDLDNLIVNIEWGGFDSPNLKQTVFDKAVDAHSPNPGKQHLEKMVSGMYLGEVTRRAALYVLGESELPEEFKIHLDTGDLSEFLRNPESHIFGQKMTPQAKQAVISIGEAVLDRSAAVCAAALAAVAEKSLKGAADENLTIGIDGSLFIKGYNYQLRLERELRKVCSFASRVKFVRSSDGSGVGAAVIAAALSSKR